MNRKESQIQTKLGISLVVLVITIIVILILSGAVILSIVLNNPISQANEATFKADLDAIKSDYSMYLASQYGEVKTYYPDKLNANELSAEYNGINLPGKTIKDIIPILDTTDKYNGQFEVVNGELIYLGTDRTKKRWAQDVNVEVIDADRLDAVITSTMALPVSAGTDVVVNIKYSSNASIDKINLTDKLELLDENNVPILNQPVFEMGTPTGTNVDTLRSINVTIKTDALFEGVYKLKLKPASVYNIYDVTITKEIVTNVLFEIDNTPPTNPTMSVDPIGWTNGDVTVSITYPTDSIINEYSLDGTNWTTYTLPIVITENNKTVYARGTDIAGNQSSQSTITIANIDRDKPVVDFLPNGGVNLQTISTKVTVTDVGVSNLKSNSLQYVWDTQNVTAPLTGWNSFVNGDTITTSGDNTYYLWIIATDNTGNTIVTKSNSYTGDITPPTNPTMSPSTTSWTNADITLTITYPPDAVVREYSTDGVTWNTYTIPVIISTNNTTVYARGTDASGNQSGQSTITIANIDKTAPTVIYGTNGGTNIQTASTTVSVNDLGGSDINASTIQYVWDTQNTTTPTSGWVNFTNGQTITKTNVTGAYYLWIKAIDNAGNISITKSNAFGLDVTPPINPTMSASPSGWTNGNVAVTITYPGDATVKEYSTNGTNWSIYSSPVVVSTNNTTVYSRATDASGNQSGQSTLTVSNIDRALPTITATYKKADGTTYTSDTWTNQSVTITGIGNDGSGSGIASYQITYNGLEFYDLPGGTVTLTTSGRTGVWVRAIDNVGNVGALTPNFIVSIDKTEPIITLSQTATKEYTKTITTSIYDNESSIAVKKWAKGAQSIGYFASSGTVFTGTTFDVNENATYTVYTKNNAGTEKVTTIDVTNVLLLKTYKGTVGLAYADGATSDASGIITLPAYVTKPAVQYGPYQALQPGNYQVTITGENLNQGQLSTYYGHLAVGYGINVSRTVTTNTSNTIVYNFTLTDAIIDYESVIHNYSSYIIKINGIEIKQIP